MNGGARPVPLYSARGSDQRAHASWREVESVSVLPSGEGRGLSPPSPSSARHDNPNGQLHIVRQQAEAMGLTLR
eukprot:5255769-Prymnesium_polylepis.1